ncbi:MAG: tetratricopeptide repeat protein [Elusimicrobiota bacterium]
MVREITSSPLVREGVAFFNQGKFPAAARAFETAVRAGDETPWTHCFLAHSYVSMGKEQKALRHLRETFRGKTPPIPVLLALGDIAERTGDIKEAVRCLHRAVIRSSGSVEARLKLGGLRLRQRHFAAAEKQLRAAVELDRKSTAGHLLLGKALAAGGRHEEAARSYQEALALAPRSADVRRLLSATSLRIGRTAAALEHAQEALRIDDDAPEGHLLLGNILEDSGRLNEAAAAYREALKRRPDLFEAHLRWGQTLLKCGKFPEARQRLRDALALNAASLEACLLLADVYRQEGDLTSMRECLQPVLKRAPSAGAGAAYHRFASLMSLGEYAEACAEADRLLGMKNAGKEHALLYRFWALDWLRPLPKNLYAEHLHALHALAAKRPRSPWPRFFAGALLCHMGRGWEGLALLDAAPQPRGRGGWMRCAAGFQRLHLGLYRDAAADFTAALKFLPGAWWAWCFLAETHLCAGDAARAQKDMVRAEKSAPDAAARGEILAWWGEILLWQGRYKEALCRLEATGSAYAACWRGAALMQLGRNDEALAALDRALTPGARDPEALVWRGELRRRLGRHKESLTDLDQAVQLGGGSWALVNRALTRRRLGDQAGMWRDFAAVPDELVGHAAAHSRRPWDADGAAALLERLLKSARGVRRTDRYVSPVWMNR